MDSFQTALATMSNGQAMPLEAPSGTLQCPKGTIRFGIFFDGTGNNKWVDNKNVGKPLTKKPEDTPNGPTNVVRLYDAYKTQGTVLDKAYHHGVGTDHVSWTETTQSLIDKEKAKPDTDETKDSAAKTAAPYYPTNKEGMLFGVGGKARIDWGLRMLAEFFSNNNNDKAQYKLFDVCGFSRGAGLARDFVNQVNNQRIANLNVKVERRFYGLGPLEADAISTSPVDIRASMKSPDSIAGRRGNYAPIDPATITPKFMAIFDTVEAWGMGTGKWLANINHAYVETCVHMIAEDEFRYLFPVTSIFMDPNTSKKRRDFPRIGNRPARPDPSDAYQEPLDYKAWMLEIWYPGCHSDIGGSYLPRSNKKWDLQFIMLRDMHLAMVKAGVPIGDVQQPSGDVLKPYQEYCAYRFGKDWALHQEKAPDQTQYIHWYDPDQYMARFYGIDEHPDLIYRGLNAGMAGLAQSGGGGMGYAPPPPRPTPPQEKWPESLKQLAKDARELQPCVKTLLAEYIHDSATESPGSSFLGEAMPKDGLGRLRLQRKVIPGGAQPPYKGKPVRKERLPSKSTT